MRKRSRRVLIGVGVVVVALAVLYAVGLARSMARLRRAYAALEANGRPMDASEVIPAPVPDTKNAAVLYKSAALMLKAQPSPEKTLLEYMGDMSRRFLRDSLDRESEMELGALIDQPMVTHALKAVEQGVQRLTCRFDRHYEGIRMELEIPALAEATDLAFILGAKARFEAQAGNTSAAWETVLTQLRLADSLRSDPTLGAQYTRLGTIGRACRVIQELCEAELSVTTFQATIDELLRSADDLDPFIRALDAERLLIGERLFKLPRWELDHLLRADAESGDTYIPEIIGEAIHQLQFRMIVFRPRLVADHAAYLEMMNKRTQLFLASRQDREVYQENLAGSAWNLLTYRLNLGMGYEKWFYYRAIVQPRLTRAGLALLQYRRGHGAFPETLNALHVEGLTDPFTDEPLHYRRENRGFIVYSVGEDRKDNGGRPRPKRESSDPRSPRVEYDILWRYPAPKTDRTTNGH